MARAWPAPFREKGVGSGARPGPAVGPGRRPGHGALSERALQRKRSPAATKNLQNLAPNNLRKLARVQIESYRQSDRALAVHWPKPLVTMLRMTAQTYVRSAAGLSGPAL